MSEVQEVPPYSDRVTESLLSLNHPDVQWLAEDYVTIVDYITSPTVDEGLEHAYEEVVRRSDQSGNLARQLLSTLTYEHVAEYDDVMHLLEQTIWERLLETRNSQLIEGNDANLAVDENMRVGAL